MRHFLASAAIPGLAGRVVKVTRAAPLIAPAGLAQGPLPRVGRTRRRAVPLAPVTPPAQEELLTTVQSATDHQPQRIHAPPRSGRGGWTITGGRAKKGAASRALPSCDPPEGPGWSDSEPSPLSAVGGTALPQFLSSTQLTRRASAGREFRAFSSRSTVRRYRGQVAKRR